MGTLKAGAIETANITTDGFLAFQGTVDNLLITSGLVSPSIKTELISPLADKTDVNIQIGKKNEITNESEFGKLVVQDATGSAVASIDSSGNATFSGTLESDEVKSNDVIAGKIYADEIVARNGQFNNINTDKLSGITREQIENLLRQAEADQKLLADSGSWNIHTATDSAHLAKVDIQEATIENLFVTGTTALSSLSVSTSITVGPDMVIASQINALTNQPINSIDSLTAPLSIQSLAMAPVEIMAGLIKIDTQGNVTITGNLSVAGKIDSSQLTVKGIDSQPADNNLLSLQDSSGLQVASVSATGAAQLKQLTTDGLVIAGADTATASANLFGEIETNATAGHAKLNAGEVEITIRNNKVTNYTLVYVTPTSSTQNNVLYVKAKDNGFFKVGFNQAIDIDAEFNWWIIEAQIGSQ